LVNFPLSVRIIGLILVFLNQKVEPGIDFDRRFADRFLYQNRIAIDPENFLIAIMDAILI